MRNFIRRWLGLTPATAANELGRAICEPPSYAYTNSDHLFSGQKQRNIFEVINAINGKIVVFNHRVDNPNGPDKNDMEIYLVPTGADLMETITAAVAAARLK